LDGKEKAGHEKIREPRFQDLSTNGLVHVEKALDLFLKSEAEDSLLSFFLERGQSTFALFRGGVRAICCFGRGVVLERTVREVFAEAGAVPISEVRNPVAGYQIFTYQLPLVRSQLLKVVT
jgi:hypothetical protein